MSSDTIPPIVDILNHLNAIRDDSSNVEGQVDSIATELSRLPSGESDASLIDQIDNMLLALEQRVRGEAEREVETARNRLLTYRRHRRRKSSFLGHTEPTVTERVSGKRTGLPDRTGETARITTTVTNRGDLRDVAVVIQILDSDGRVLQQTVTEEKAVSVGEKQRVSTEVYVPNDAEDITLAAKNTVEQNTIGDLI